MGLIDDLLWNALKNHWGHHLEVALYGDKSNPDDVCLECLDCNEIVLDAEIYTLTVRSDLNEF